jgi:diguanylate cyclase (GGDEF)-like protein
MNGKSSRGSVTAGDRAKHRMRVILVFLGVPVLAMVAYLLGTDMVVRAAAVAGGQHLANSLALLVFTGLLVACVGAVLIWSTVSSLARTRDVEPNQDGLEKAREVEENGLLMNSVTRMLNTIERQATGLERLDTANRELESANARLQAVTVTDEVTGVYNRRFFSIRLEEEVARHRRFARPLSLVLLDLDRFKAVNEDLGRQAGDETLRRVAQIVLKNSRGIDVVFRHGDDEFAVLLVETARAGAQSCAGHIRDVLCTSSFSHGRLVTASFGVACFPEAAATADDLVRAADEALCSAKRAGRNRVVVCTELGVLRLAEREAPA